MMGRGRRRVRGGAVAVWAAALLLMACGDDGTVPDPLPDDPLVSLFVVSGGDQAAVTGRQLPDSVWIDGLLASGAEGFFGPVRFEIVEGDGTVEFDGATATGPGSGIVGFNDGEGAAFAWRMGAPETPHRVRAWAVGLPGDTVETFVTATSVVDAPLDRIEVQGDAQSAPEGQLLPDTIRVRGVLEHGYPFLEPLHVEILSGGGWVYVGPTRGSGAGATLTMSPRRDGTAGFTWRMGTAGVEHRVRVYGLRSDADTVAVEIVATSAEAG